MTIITDKLRHLQYLKEMTRSLEEDIRKLRNRCNHKYNDKIHYDSKYIYIRCIRCKKEIVIEHNIPEEKLRIYSSLERGIILKTRQDDYLKSLKK